MNDYGSEVAIKLRTDPLGKIVHEITEKLRKHFSLEDPSENQKSIVQRLFHKLDSGCADLHQNGNIGALLRPDVLLWRNSVSVGTFKHGWWHDDTSPFTLLDRENLDTMLDACVNAKDPLVFWSALTHAVAMNDPEAKGFLPIEPIEAHRFLTKLYSRVNVGVARPEGAEVTCEYFYLMARIRVEAGGPGTVADHDTESISSFLAEIEQIIHKIDGSWKAGRNIDFRSALEQHDTFRLSPRDSYTDQCIMARCLGLLRPIAHGRVIATSDDFSKAEEMSQKTAGLAKTAWKAIRSRRLSEQNFVIAQVVGRKLLIGALECESSFGWCPEPDTA